MFSLALQNGSKTTEEMENGWTLISLEDLWGDHHCFCRGLGFLGLFEWDALPPFQQRINKEAFETWMDKIITSAAGSCIFLTLMKRIWKGVQGLGHHNLNAKSQTRVETHLSHLEPVFIAVSAVIAGSMRTAKFLLAIGYYYVTKLLGRKTAPFFKSVNHTITLVWVKTAPHGWFPLRPQLCVVWSGLMPWPKATCWQVTWKALLLPARLCQQGDQRTSVARWTHQQSRTRIYNLYIGTPFLVVATISWIVGKPCWH